MEDRKIPISVLEQFTTSFIYESACTSTFYSHINVDITEHFSARIYIAVSLLYIIIVLYSLIYLMLYVHHVTVGV